MTYVQPIITQQPRTVVTQQQPLRGWNSGLLSCFDDCGGCLCASFCTICALCSVAQRLDENSCAPFLVPGSILAMRVKLRAKYGIEGSICCDGCCVIPFCGLCAICQMDRELKHVGRL